MKTTIYGLLGMIKDGKAPKKIKFGSVIYKYSKEIADYRDESDIDLFDDKINTFMLNDEVEILDEPKEDKIEKIDLSEYRLDLYEDEQSIEEIIHDALYDIEVKINELIDEVNKLKEKK